MRSATALRINWLLPDVEVYRTERADMLPSIQYGNLPTCIRCGNACRRAARGNWQPIVAYTRMRGTRSRARDTVAIHRGCVPGRPKR